MQCGHDAAESHLKDYGDACEARGDHVHADAELGVRRRRREGKSSNASLSGTRRLLLEHDSIVSMANNSLQNGE